MKKRILSVILCVVMLLSAMPLTNVFAAEIAGGTCGDNLTWTLDDEGTLTIIGTGKMTNYDYVTSPWQYNSSINKVFIENGVTSIGYWAFYHCTRLTSVTIPDSVTSIGVVAFSYCYSLTSVTIPDSVTSIGDGAFRNCSSLTSVTIPDSVTSIGDYAFEGCSSLTSVTIGNSVTSIGDRAFEGCSSLISIDVDANNENYSSQDGVLFNKDKTELIQYPIGNSRTTYAIPDSVTSIGDFAFSYCYSLTSVTIPDSVTSIGDWAFRGCTSLTSIDVDENNANYSSQDGVLFNKDKTELIQYPIGNSRTTYAIPDSVTSIGGVAFSYCYSLTSVTIPDSVTSIGYGAFEDCSSLTSVTIPDSVTSIGYDAFYHCNNLTDVYYSGTTEDWNKISIEDYNEPLLNANIHYCHVCDYSIEETKAPTCTEKGYTIYKCECGKSYKEELAALGHQNTITINAKTPTCSEEGYTGDTYCEDCENIIANGEAIKTIPHTSETDKAVAPTCTETGLTEGKHCSVCTAVLTKQEVVEAKGHTPAMSNMIPATCTETGLTSGTYCTVCGAVLVAQEIIPATDHKYGEITYTWSEDLTECTAVKPCLNNSKHDITETAKVTVKTTDPTCTEEGSREYIAAFNNKTFFTQEKSETVPALQHRNAYIVEEIPATCTEKGFGAGKFCPDCDKFIEGHESLPATGHNNVGGKCTACGHDFTKECDCKCHSSGFSLFIWKIGNFFKKIFKKDQVCDCGKAHW